MKPTQKLHDMGQSLWLDNITRGLLTSGTLRRYIQEFSVTGLTSNPTIFDHAIKNSRDYDDCHPPEIEGRQVGRDAVLRTGAGGSHAGRRSVSADPRPDQRRGRLGVAGGLAPAGPRHVDHPRRGQGTSRPGERPNLFIKIPGTKEGLPAIEEAIFAGVPVNVTLLFSREQYVAAAEAYLRGIERRIAAGLNPDVGSVASMFISRWDVAVTGKVPENLRNQLGIAIAKRTYKAYRALIDSPRWQRILNAGARPQRLLWASTGTKDPSASDLLYIKALAAPLTVNTMPERTLNALADHGEVESMLPAMVATAKRCSPGSPKPASTSMRWPLSFRTKGPNPFVKSWNELMACIASKSEALK